MSSIFRAPNIVQFAWVNSPNDLNQKQIQQLKQSTNESKSNESHGIRWQRSEKSNALILVRRLESNEEDEV
jgi:hypothetical protein